MSCKKDEIDIEKEGVKQESETKIILGKKIENPYSVENMKKAYESIVNSQAKIPLTKGSASIKSVAETIEISVNHKYVRFWCGSSGDEEKLNDREIKFSNIPLDREILEEGDDEFYINKDESTSEENQGYWIYTALYVDVDLDSFGLKYEVLEDLFLFEDAQGEEEDEEHVKIPLARATNSQLSFYEQLEKETFKITNNEIEEEDGNRLPKVNGANGIERCWFRCSGRKQPRGKIRVKNTITGIYEPVEGVKVRTYRWFVWGHGYTNSNGDYKINKKYRHRPWYYIDFDNPSNKCKLYSSWLSVSDATYRSGRHSRNGYSKDFDTNSYGWRFATVNNAIVKYRKYCKELGIGTFNGKIRVNVTSGTGDASAPMLGHTYGALGFNSHSDVSNFFINAIPFTIANSSVGYLVRLNLLPDVWIQGNSSQGTAGVYSKVFHEMAHTSHFAKVGSAYWTKYVNYIITYGAYGDGTGRNAGVCGVGEMWGNYFGHVCLHKAFPGWRFSFDDEEDWYNPGFLEKVDKIPDVTTSEIYSTLTTTTTSFKELKRKLKWKTREDEKIDAAFNSYTDWP